MLSEGQNPAADDGADEPKRNKMIQGQAFRADACRQADPITVAAVSYTHLDVYKRQVPAIMLIAASIFAAFKSGIFISAIF